MVFVEANWWLYVLLVVALALLLVVNLYILVYWQHPDDKNEAYFPKGLVIVGMTLAQGAVLLLPLDAANNSGDVECNQSWSDVFCGALDMHLAWSIVFITTFVLAFFIIPYTIFFYEEDDSIVLEGRKNCWKAFCVASRYMVVVAIIVALVVALMYTIMGFTDIPVEDFSVPVATLLSSANTFTIPDTTGAAADLTSFTATSGVTNLSDTVELQVSFPVYVMALTSFVGWFLFVMFGGLGLPAIPVDGIRGFTNRPQRLDRAQVAALEVGIQRRVNELIEIGKLLKGDRAEGRAEVADAGYLERRRRNNKDAAEFKKFKQMVYLLQEDYDTMVICRDYNRKFNPLTPVFSLMVGIVSLVIALCWVVHMVIYMLFDPPVTPFLNDYFIWFDGWFPLFGVLTVAIFSFYLLVSCVKGCFKYGLRLGWFTLHPMKPNGTYMNSFLFNVGIVLLCSSPVIQFCVQAFQDYLRNTEVTNFFNVQVRYLRFFRWFYANNVFVYALLILTLLSFLWLSCKPRATPANSNQIRETLQKAGDQYGDSPSGGARRGSRASRA